MKSIQKIFLVWLLAIPMMAFARLPVPSAEEAAKKLAAAEKKALDEEAAKVSLGRSQDRVAQRYRFRHPNAPEPVPVVIPVTAAKK